MFFSLTMQDSVTAVDVASLKGHKDVVYFLVKAGAYANPMVS